MTWKVVEFGLQSSDGAACRTSVNKPDSVVPLLWIFEKEGKKLCWWPSKQYISVTASVRRMAQPQPDWESWHVLKVYGETFDDYMKAREVLQSSSDVTDLEERIQLLREKEYGREKRSPKRKNMYDVVDIRNERGCNARSVLTTPPTFSSDEDESCAGEAVPD